MSLTKFVSSRCISPVLLAAAGVSMLCMSAVSPDARADVDLAAAGAPSFVAATFDVDCPGVKRARCNVNHHCPWPTPGADDGDEIKHAKIVENSKKYCTEDERHFIGCSHVHLVSLCAIPIE